MQAYSYRRYGPPREVLSRVDLPVPTPGPGEVLVRLDAVGINGSDHEIVTGSPLYSRVYGPIRPRHPVLGSDIAGRVEACGPGITGFRVGDRVFGDVFERWGGFAEYLTAPAEMLLQLPVGLDPVTAAALPQSGTNALQPIRDDASLAPGERVLINGACGGAGHLAIQLAKAAGAHVTAVDRASKLDLAAEVGADTLIDFETTDFTEGSEPYDLILDYFATRSPRAYRRVLTPTGTYMFFGGTMKALWSLLTIGLLTSRKNGRTFKLEAVTQTRARQADMAGMVAKGDIRLALDRTYPFDRLIDALEQVGRGEVRGKVVVVFDG